MLRFSFLSFLVILAFLPACNPVDTGISEDGAQDGAKTYSLKVDIPESQAPAGKSTSSRSANAAASFAIVDIDPATGKIVKTHTIENAFQKEDDNWAVVVDSNPNAASFAIVSKNDNAPTVCINCDLPSDSVYSPLVETNIDVDTLTTIASQSIIETGQVLSIEETQSFVDGIHQHIDQLEGMDQGQTLSEYIQEQKALLKPEINREVFETTQVASEPLNDTGNVTCDDYAYTDNFVTNGTNPDGTYDISGSGLNDISMDCLALPSVPTRDTDGLDEDGDIVRAGGDWLYGRDYLVNDNSDGHAGFSFTKLDANGNSLDASASSWSCVRDNVTGRIWEVKTRDDGIQDAKWTFTNYNSSGVNDAGNAGFEDGGTCSGSGCDTEKYVSDINAMNGDEGLCGYSDWRLPQVEELVSIINNNSRPTYLDTDYFPNVYWWNEPEYVTTDYYSGTPIYLPDSPAYTLYANVRFADGTVRGSTGNHARHVRLVRSDEFALVDKPGTCTNKRPDVYYTKPDILYIDNEDGTVTDSQTGLMWQKCPNGLSGANCSNGTAETYTWQAAFKAMNDLNLAGHSDWRLPNAKELQSLKETACYAPMINTGAFPNTPTGDFWSSTPYNDDVRAITVDGYYWWSPAFLYEEYHVRAVRNQ